MILDGTLISIDRVGMRAKADRPYYSGKHKWHGLNVQVLTDPAGRLLWASPALPGSVHGVTAARRHGLVHALTGYDVPVLADRGYQGAAGTIRVPFRGRDLPAGRGQHQPRPATRSRGAWPRHPQDLAPTAPPAPLPNAALPSSSPSPPSKPPPEPEVGKGSLKYERLYREHIPDGLALAGHAEDYRVEFNTVRPREALAWNRPLEVHLGQADRTMPNFDRAGPLPPA